MRTVAVSGYTAKVIEKELLKSGRTMSFRYERYDKNNVLQGEFAGVSGGSVDHASFADISGTAKFKIKSIPGTDWANDRCKPFVRLKMPDEYVTGDVVSARTNVTSVVAAVASSSYASPSIANPMNAWDNNPGTYWHAEGIRLPTLPEWTYGQLSISRVCTAATIRLYAYASSRDITAFQIQGSHDAVSWDVLGNYTGVVWVASPNQVQKFSFSNTTSYLYYRIYVTALVSEPYLMIQDIWLEENWNGDTPNTEYLTYSWTGTPGASSSMVQETGPKKRVEKWAEWPMGMFLLSSPTTSTTKMREVDAYDQSFILLMDKVTDRYNVAVGSIVTDAISTLLVSAGITLRTIAPSPLTLPTARDWDPGTPKATIINALLSSINYQALWFDGDGYAICRPYQSPSDAPVGRTYKDDTSSVLMNEGSRTLDLFGVPNKWVLYISDPDRGPLRSEYTNADPSSPTSTVARGFTIVDYREETDAVDQTTLDAKVAIIAYEASQIYEKIIVNTGLMPMHEHLDVLSLRYGLLEIDGRYQETDWSMSLEAGTKMTHSIRRLVKL